MSQHDSIDKIVSAYFAAVSKYNFTYNGELYPAKPLHISPQFFNEFECVPYCAGCCSKRFSLDYLPGDARPDYEHVERYFLINDTKVKIFSKLQKSDPKKRFCDNVNPTNGYCNIHGSQPFSCDFETLRFVHYADHTWLGVRPYGRGWNMLRVDGIRGAMCKFSKESTDNARLDGIRKLRRLKQWTDAAKLDTWLPEVIEWAERGISDEPLILGDCK